MDVLLHILYVGIRAGTGRYAAGQRVIKGIVTDAQTKESLIGASVTVKDLHTGSITGLDGSYRIGGLLSGCLPRGSRHSYGGGQCRSESGI